MNRKQPWDAKYGRDSSNPPRKPSELIELLDAGVRHHQGGRLADAEACYRSVLAADPNHADAFHLLGIIALQAGRAEASVELILQAIKLNKQNPHYFSNLGNALNTLKRFDESLSSCNKALALAPDFAEAFNNRGNTLLELKRLDDALASYKEALALQPDNAHALGRSKLARQRPS
jgi:protein O-GlcNAc transferase